MGKTYQGLTNIGQSVWILQYFHSLTTLPGRYSLQLQDRDQPVGMACKCKNCTISKKSNGIVIAMQKEYQYEENQ